MTPEEFIQKVPEEYRERFTSKVDFSGSCWIWTAGKNHGYGRVGFQQALHYAHRLAYEWARGPIPAGLHLDHLCRTPACIKPEHLEAVTCAQNVLRGVGACATYARRTHCRRGHELDRNGVKPLRRCHRCTSERRAANIDSVRASKRREYQKHRDRYLQRAREWHLKNRKKNKENNSAASHEQNAA